MTINRAWSQMLDRAVEFVIMHRRSVFWGLLALLVASSAGMARISIENDFRAFVGNDNRALETNDWLTARLGQASESVVLLYRPADRNAFSLVSLLQYTQLAQRAQKLPGAKGTTSWLELDKLVEVTMPEGEVRRKAAPFLFGMDALSPESAAVIRRDALSSPAIAGRYIGRDGATAAVVVSVDLGQGAHARRRAVDRLRAAVAVIETELQRVVPGDSLSMAGTTLFDHAAFLILKKDLRTLFPIAVVLVALVLWAIYRSVAFVGLFMLLTLLPVTATAGLTAVAGVDYTNLSIAGLLLVGTLAVADVMHISNSFFLLLGRGTPKEEALRYAFRHNLFAVTATTSTTVMGEATLFFTSPPPVQQMGIIVIAGSVLALFLAVTMLPHALAIVRPPRSGTLQGLSDAMARLSAACWARGRTVLAVFAAMTVACAMMIPASRIDDSLQGWFGERTTFHRDLALLKAQYLGSETVVLAMELTTDDMIAARQHPSPSPSTALYADLARSLRQAAGPGEWLDVVSVAEARRRQLDTGAETVYRPASSVPIDSLKPFTVESLARAGLVTRNEPGRADYSIWYFHSHANSSFALTETAERLHQVMVSKAAGRDVRSGGVGLAIAQVSVTNLRQVLYGSAIVFGLIVISMFVVFRSPWLGALSIVPNVAPVVFSFGLWAAMVGEINMAAITVLGIAFGIVVDDTIHLLTKYRENLAEFGLGQMAFRESVRECGVGVLATTLILAGGFALLGASDFLLTAQRSQLCAMTITVALVFDLMMLPALLSVVGGSSTASRAPATP
ncbi:MAG: MMPL family transporter [Burkholderiales bacterium]|nr:MMPL family transporter [Burkholderiales bacterium]